MNNRCCIKLSKQVSAVNLKAVLILVFITYMEIMKTSIVKFVDMQKVAIAH